MIILGIDPGSIRTGYGIISVEQKQQRYLASGCIKTKGETASAKLKQIFEGIQQIVAEYQPAEAAIEEVFMQANPKSALTLGQARGVAMVAAALAGLPVAEYSPRQIKQAAVGYGAAQKEQVQHMVRCLLNLSQTPQSDAADALAVALCHANMRFSGLQKYGITGVAWRRAK